MGLSKYFHIALIGLTLSLMTGSAYSASCDALLKKSQDWIKKSNSHYNHHVVYQFNWQEGHAKWQGFMQGRMTQYLGAGLWARKNKVMFSDRAWCPELPRGQICAMPYQPFNYKRSNTWSITLSPGDKLSVMMHDWNTTKKVKAWCQGNHVYGFHGNSMVHLSLGFTKVGIPR